MREQSWYHGDDDDINRSDIMIIMMMMTLKGVCKAESGGSRGEEGARTGEGWGELIDDDDDTDHTGFDDDDDDDDTGFDDDDDDEVKVISTSFR